MVKEPGVVAQPLTEALGKQRNTDLCSMVAWSTQRIPGQSGHYSETLSPNNKGEMFKLIVGDKRLSGRALA